MTEYYTACRKCQDSSESDNAGQFIEISDGAVAAVASCSEHSRSWFVLPNHALKADSKRQNND